MVNLHKPIHPTSLPYCSFCIYLIVSLEQTIHRNNLDPEEEGWTFGQVLAIQPLRWPTTILVNRMVNLHKPIHPTSLLTLRYHPRDVGCDCGWLCSYFHMYVAVLVWVCCVPETEVE
jgi:hypothetical protein